MTCDFLLAAWLALDQAALSSLQGFRLKQLLSKFVCFSALQNTF